MSKENYRTVVNLMTGIISMVLNLTINFFLTSYIVSNLGEEANGFVQLANNFVSYVSLVTIAFNSMAGRHISVSFHQNKKIKAQRYYTSIIICNIFITVLFIPVAYYLVCNLQYILNVVNVDVNDIKFLFVYVFLNFVLNLFLTLFLIPMFITNSVYLQNIMNIMKYIFNIALIFMFFNFFGIKIYYVSFVAVLLTIVMLPIAIFYKKRLLPDVKFNVLFFDIKAVKTMLLSGIWNTINQCGNLLMTGMDLLFTNIFIDPVMMGSLSISKMMPTAIYSLANTINSNIAPTVTISWAKKDDNLLIRKLRRSMKTSSIIITIPIVTFCCFGISFYSLWMPSLDAVMLTRLSFLSCMSFIPWAGPQVLYNVYTATNKLKMNSITFLITGLLNVVLVYMSLRYTDWGVYAIAGVSSILSIARNLLFTVPYVAKVLHLKWYIFYNDVLVSLFCSLINFGVASVVKRIFTIHNWFEYLLVVSVTCAMSLIMDLIVVLDRTEKEYIVNKIKRIFKLRMYE